jgi:carboxypeptidase Taq
MSNDWNDLLERIREMRDLASANALLDWDQASMMPPKGGEARARAIGTMTRLYHERLIDPAVGELLDRLGDETSLDEAQTATVRVLKRERDKATKVPTDLVLALSEAENRGYQIWTEAKPASDFNRFRPAFEEIVNLKKQEADALGWEGERYDACLDFFEPSMTTAEVEALFTELIGGLEPMAQKILDAAGEKPAFLDDGYPADSQLTFCNALVDRLGFDREGGRLDFSPHPFTIGLAHGDVRQTIKIEENDLMMSIYAAIHETGHALYEQGYPEALAGLPTYDAPSMGMHESQSRLWENQIGRSRPFAEHLLTGLKELFAAQLGSTSVDEFFRGINHPSRSLIRIKADEVTYNLHIALRFELELALFRDELEVADLPDAWDAAMEKRLGLRPANHAEGILQDMHWATGYIGYFPTYTLGSLYAAAFHDKMVADLGNLDDELRAGETGRVLTWLRDNIHLAGYLYPAKDLARKVLGEDLSTQPFLEHIRSKYGSLYSLSI